MREGHAETGDKSIGDQEAGDVGYEVADYESDDCDEGADEAGLLRAENVLEVNANWSK